jgi:hypothetical protein
LNQFIVTVTIMSIPLFFPPVKYLLAMQLSHPIELEELCRLAGVPCRASGNWVRRKIEIVPRDELKVFAEPGDWGSVRIEVFARSKLERYRIALGAMAYLLHDPVARQSIAGSDWAKPGTPRGRPRKSRALSSKERQRLFRERNGSKQ